MGESVKVVARNRKARHNYRIEETIEAGVALMGSEVKSLREGKVNLAEAYCMVENGEVVMRQCHISPYKNAAHFGHEPARPRKLLLHRREILKLQKLVQQKSYTLIPLSVYFKRGIAKVELGIARGKRQYDKRADIADRETKRRLDRIQRGGKAEGN